MDDPLLLALPAFLALIGLEAFCYRRRDWYSAPDTASSLTIGLSNLLVSTLTKGSTLAIYVAAHQFAVLAIPETASVLAIAIVADDLTVYWHHRVHHRCRLLWATHAVHHSSRHMNLGTAFRHSFLTPLTEPVFYLPMALIGFDPLMMLTCQSISLIYGFFVHTECVRKLGVLEWLLVTPSHHRVHHGINARYLDRNYGGIFIVWDRLFGTFEPEAEAPRYGLVTDLESVNPLWVTFHEWRRLAAELQRAPSWAQRLSCLFGPPIEHRVARSRAT